MPRHCKKFRVDAARNANPNRVGLARHYFSQTCPDPYTSLNYWRRRFNSQNCYLGNYFVPYTTRSNSFGTTVPYKSNGFSMGNSCPVLYLPRGRCNLTKYGGNLCAVVGQGRR